MFHTPIGCTDAVCVCVRIIIMIEWKLYERIKFSFSYSFEIHRRCFCRGRPFFFVFLYPAAFFVWFSLSLSPVFFLALIQCGKWTWNPYTDTHAWMVVCVCVTLATQWFGIFRFNNWVTKITNFIELQKEPNTKKKTKQKQEYVQPTHHANAVRTPTEGQFYSFPFLFAHRYV